MKTRNVHLPLLLFGLLSASPALAVRDPFWPIGYSPASAKVPEPVHVAEPAPEPEPPRENPVSTDDWLKARKALTISGTTIATKPGTHETRTLVMINRQMYAAGDTVSLVHEDIRFHWRVASASNKDVRLEPLQAERVVRQKPALKQIQ